MAVSNLFPTLWSARITHFTEQTSAFLPNATRAWEGEAVYGNKINIPTIGRGVTVQTYSRTADLAAPEAITTSTQTLNIDQEKYFNFALEDLDARQSRISGSELIDIKAAGAGLALSADVDTYVEAQLEAATISAGSTTAADFDAELFAEIKRIAATKGVSWRNLVIVSTPEFVENVEKKVIDGTYGDVVLAEAFRTGAMDDPTAVPSGFAGRVLGIPLYASASLTMRADSGGTSVSASDRGDQSQVFVYDPRDLALVQQVNRVETYRIEKRFATGVKGLLNYGAKVLNAGRMQEYLINDVT